MMNDILLLINMEYGQIIIQASFYYLLIYVSKKLTYLIYKFIVMYRLQFFECFQFLARLVFYVPPFMYNIKSNKQTTQVTVFET